MPNLILNNLLYQFLLMCTCNKDCLFNLVKVSIKTNIETVCLLYIMYVRPQIKAHVVL